MCVSVPVRMSAVCVIHTVYVCVCVCAYVCCVCVYVCLCLCQWRGVLVLDLPWWDGAEGEGGNNASGSATFFRLFSEDELSIKTFKC